MADGQKNPASGIIFVLIALLVAAPFLLSPLYLGALESDEQKFARQVDPGIQRVIALLDRIDENLGTVGEIRRRLVAGGVELTADAAQQTAANKAEIFEEIDLDLRQGRLRIDRLLEATLAQSKKWIGSFEANWPRGLGGRGGPYGRKSFQELETLLKQNDELVGTADREVTAVLSLKGPDGLTGRNYIWANRAAALVAWMKGRIARDRAWLDRWQASELRAVARKQMAEAAALRQMAESSGRRTPEQAIDDVTARRTTLEQQLAGLREQSARLETQVHQRTAEIKQLRAQAAAAREQVARMDSEQFTPQNPLKAGQEFAAYRSKYEELSAAARQAEAKADALEFGALWGGHLAEEADGNVLYGVYVDAKPTQGLIEFETRLEAVKEAIHQFERQLESADGRLAVLNDSARMLDEQRQSLALAAAAESEAARTTLRRIEELMASAESQQESGVQAFTAGKRAAKDAQRPAQQWIQAASKIKREAAGAPTGERLKAILSDRDTEAGILVLAASLAWSTAEMYAQGIADVRAHQGLLQAAVAFLGAEPPEDRGERIEKWRSKAEQELAAALGDLKKAKQLIAQANYQSLTGQRVSGTDYHWQVTQLEGAVHMLAALLADTPDVAEGFRDKARVALRDALEGRQDSPLLSQAKAALKSIE